ncbi:MAG: hypothetical protein ABL967_07535 [Bryobacteraceae bacterium]
MEELLKSMIRFSAAFSAFGLHQLQLAVTAPGESFQSLNQVREAMDAVADVLIENVDAQQRQVLSSLVGVGTGFVARSAGMVDASLFDPNRIVRTVTDIAQKASDTVLGAASGEVAASRLRSGE